MNSNKENLDPNRPSHKTHSVWSKRSLGPKVSKFQGIDKDWKKKIMMPSER